MRPFTIALCATLLFIAAPYSANAADTAGFYEKFPKLDQSRWAVSNGWTNGDYQSCEWRQDAIMATPGDVRLTVSDRGGKIRPIGCPEMHTTTRLGYGLYETKMRSAGGSGLDTGFFTYIGPPNGVKEWDEIDFEFLGKNTHSVQVNYFTNGQHAGHDKVIPLDFDASQTFHTYAFDWEPTKIRWYIDGKMVYESADGEKIPHNPGYLFYNIWSGATGAKAEDSWLGPFNYQSPATADVQWVAYTPTDAPCQFPESIKCKNKQ